MEDDDDALYTDWLAQACRSNGVKVWSYYLMPNHIHLILVPADAERYRAIQDTYRAIQDTHISAERKVSGAESQYLRQIARSHAALSS
jgi:putative transposase